MNKTRMTILALMLSSICGGNLLRLSTPPNLTLPAAAEESKPTGGHKSKQQERALHRVDFTINGTSCATCLMRIERELKKAPGVVKAAVSILAPYPAVVIYDSNKTTFEAILTALKNETATVTNKNEVPITKIPTLLIPTTNHSAAKVGPGTASPE